MMLERVERDIYKIGQEIKVLLDDANFLKNPLILGAFILLSGILLFLCVQVCILQATVNNLRDDLANVPAMNTNIAEFNKNISSFEQILDNKLEKQTTDITSYTKQRQLITLKSLGLASNLLFSEKDGSIEAHIKEN